MRPFRYINAKSIRQTVKLLGTYQGKAKLIAGGTDLLGELKDAILPEYPEIIINLKTVPGLKEIKENSRGIRIGSLVRLADIISSPVVKKSYPLLAEAAGNVATPQIRRMGTIGGNLCQDLRCWYYRYPHQVGGRITCYLKGGGRCYAVNGENEYHSIFGGVKVDKTSCSYDCPACIEIPAYLNKIRENNLPEAARILLERNPFPSITGRVCPHYCENTCARQDFDEAVSIRNIERFIGDYILDHLDELIKAPSSDTGKKIAVIGSGPAGLSAAYYLRRTGHSVTVYERMDEAGGMLAYGIPPYRLPKDIVRKVIKAIEKTGVTFKLKVDVGKDTTLDSIRKEFDSVVIASGAWGQPAVSFEGNELAQSGLDLLNKVNQGLKINTGQKVVVIGGGNVALDVAITARRLGAGDVIVACLESRTEMPALESEIQQAIEEGITLIPSRGPHRIITSDGKVTGMELVKCESVFDENGNFSPTFDYSVIESMQAEAVYLAIGQKPELSFIIGDLSTSLEKGLLAVNNDTQETGVPSIFAVGEATTGRGTVIEAIASGHRAAHAIDRYLGCNEIQAEALVSKPTDSLVNINHSSLGNIARISSQVVPFTSRTIDDEEAIGFSLDDARIEANRCFNCSCFAVNASDMAVALMALDAEVKIQGRDGVRIVTIEQFFSSARNILRVNKVVTEIRIPRIPSTAKQRYIKFRLRKAIDFPIVSVATILNTKDGVCRDARVAFGAVAPMPIRSIEVEQTLKGKPLNEATAEAAAQAAIRNAMPLDKNAHKIQILKTLVKRAILS
ncbi:FAD-dependent oxidoreductase [Chloroflexota bacterium]